MLHSIFMNHQSKFMTIIDQHMYHNTYHRLKSWMESQLDLRRQIKATCKKYNISSDGKYLTWVT